MNKARKHDRHDNEVLFRRETFFNDCEECICKPRADNHANNTEFKP